LILCSFLFLAVNDSPSINNKGGLSKVLIYLFTFIVVALPWISTVTREPDKYNLRLKVVSVTSLNSGFNSLTRIISSQSVTAVNSWLLINPQNGSGDENPRYLPSGFPLVNLLVKMGYWAGIIYGLFHIRKIYPLYIIIIAGIVGQILTVNPPNGARGLIILPCIYLLFAFGTYEIYKHLNRPGLFKTALIIVSILFAFNDFEFYKYWMTWIAM